MGGIVRDYRGRARGDPPVALPTSAALAGSPAAGCAPRHTEFLLVASRCSRWCSANLTDSVFFTPLLVAFVGSAVWTLLVHTLRSEAIEAGDPREVTRAITPGLLRMTLLASALSVVLALALFVTLPRLRSSVITGPRPLAGSAGFSQRVELGDLGRIRQDPTVALRVETLEGRAPAADAAYFRGLAFDNFDGRSWSILPPQRSPVAGSAEGGVSFGRKADPVNLVQRIVREPVDSGVLFGVGEPRQLQGTVRRLERDSSGGLYAAGQAHERVRYTLSSEQPSWRDEWPGTLRARIARPRSLSPAPGCPRVGALPPHHGGRRNDDGGARDRGHLARTGRYATPPPLGPRERSRSSLPARRLAGHCVLRLGDGGAGREVPHAWP
jgi:hypothetical protein